MNYEVARKKEKAKQTSVREKIAHDYAYACLLKEKDRSNVILYNTNTTFDRLARMKPRDLNRSIAVVLFSIIRLLTKKSIKVFFFLHWTFPRGIHTGQNQFSTIIFWNMSLTINTMRTNLFKSPSWRLIFFIRFATKVRNGKKIKNHWCNAYEKRVRGIHHERFDYRTRCREGVPRRFSCWKDTASVAGPISMSRKNLDLK